MPENMMNDYLQYKMYERVEYTTPEERKKEYYRRNKEKMLIRTREKRKDPEYRALENERNKEYYRKNREARLEYARQYRLRKRIEKAGLIQI